MRAEFGPAGKLRPRLLEDYATVDELRDSLVHDIDRYRRERNRGSVNPFRLELFDGEEGIVQIGDGCLGGKRRGLAFASRLLDEVRLSERFTGVRITVPSAVVLGTGVFDQFLDQDNLRSFALQCEDEDETLRRILAAPLPAAIMEALARAVSVVTTPIAVRSSSLLEDSPQQPLAGIYGTWLVPNNHPDLRHRLAQLVDAVKRVYATAFGRRARAFLGATSYRLEEEAMLANAQRDFWALDLAQDAPGAGWSQDGPLVRCSLRDAEDDGTLSALASTYSEENNAVYDGMGRSGVRLVTFAPVLKHNVFPLAEILQELLILGMAGTRLPVEIEFAATLGSGGEPAEMGFLQLRPVAQSREEADVRMDGVPRERIICESPSVLGRGRWDHLTDWIVVDRNRYERSQSAEVAAAVAYFNGRLSAEGRTYGLIGVGRWGSTQPWLGIPVKWEDISGARVIVEAGFRGFRVEPSQGTHFYQNLVSLGIGYFTVNANADEGFVDWDWLADTEAVESDGAVHLLRFQSPAVTILNGRERRGVILRPGT